MVTRDKYFLLKKNPDSITGTDYGKPSHTFDQYRPIVQKFNKAKGLRFK